MKTMAVLIVLTALLVGCAEMMTDAVTTKATTTRLKEPFQIQATRNYLPKDVGMQPAYTIYEGTKWDCGQRIGSGDYVCCSVEQFSSSSPWRYCLVVDTDYRAYGFMELGADKYRAWSEGKQPIFERVRNRAGNRVRPVD